MPINISCRQLLIIGLTTGLAIGCQLLAITNLLAQVAAVSQGATVKEYCQSFPTYPFSDPNPIPLFSPVYPYFRYDGFTDKPVQKEWKVVELENEYIQVMILPEIGGKIWTAIEKSTGRPFLYYNHTVKFRDVAMRGPWTSGGLEANYGIVGHTPNCATPVDYLTRKNPDGSVSCIIGVLDLLSHSNWRIEINLAPDKAFFTTQSFWYNASPLEQPYYHWMNAAIKARGDLEFIYPGNRYIGHEGEYADWPINKSNGKNISFYESNNFGGYKSYHVFGKYTHFFGGYWHDDDFGMARVATHDDKAGKKIWIWGLSGQGMIWEKLLSDTDGQYVEVQSGRLFNQGAEGSSFTPFKHRSFAPYSSDSWKEYWFPVLHTKGFVEANEYGAYNIRYEHGWLKLWFSPVQAIRDTLEVREGDRTVYSRLLLLAPLQVFADSLRMELDPQKLVSTLGTNKLVYVSDPKAGVLNRPVESPAGFDWNTAYGLYEQGKEAMDMKGYPLAEEKLQASLGKDSNYLPTLVKLAELYYRNMRYKEALDLARRALAIDTHAGDANYYYGLINARLGNVTDARDGFDIAALSPEFRSAAYTELARIGVKERDWDRALASAEKAIAYNRYDIDALQLEAVIYRHTKDAARAEEVLETILSYDALNHFAGFEKWLWQPVEEYKSAFQSLIRNELPRETYLELGVWYYQAGALEEAEKIFGLCPPTAEAAYWIGFLQGKKIDCSTIDPLLSFPARSETAVVLERLLQSQSDWLLKYQLALIYKDRNRVAESKALFSACGNEPGFAPFYAARAEVFMDSDSAGSLSDLQKAISLDKGQWRYPKLLTEFYIDHREYGKAMACIGPFYTGHPANYIVGMLYARALLLNSHYKDAYRLLSRLSIIPFEGATSGRELYREATLMQALQEMEKHRYQKGLDFIGKAELWPENLGVGRPYEEDIDVRLEDWMKYLCYRKTGKSDDATAALRRIIAFKTHVGTINDWAEAALQGNDQAHKAMQEAAHASASGEPVDRGTAGKKKGEQDVNARILRRLIPLQATL